MNFMPGVKAPSVEKIGGTSMAATETVLDNVLIAGRRGNALYQRIFVVSAYAGITDLLLERKKKHARDATPSGVYGCFVAEGDDASWQDALDTVAETMHAQNAAMFAARAGRVAADGFVDDRLRGLRDCLDDLDRLRGHGHFRLDEPLATLRELLAGLGEAHSAHNTALLLREHGVNAAFVDLTGWTDGEALDLDERIRRGLDGIDLATTMPLVTGYAKCHGEKGGGMVSRYDRGYTEMTFARLAVLTGAREAIIHKEFHLSSADPKLVGAANARKIGRTNYDVADQLANLGVEAIHPGAARGLRQAGIALRVRNTFDRHDEGTLICADYVSAAPRIEIITGLRNVYALQFFEQDMVGKKGYDSAILDVLTKHRARIVSKSSNANTITHYVDTGTATVRRVIGDLEARFPNAEVSAPLVAMVSLIGSDLSEPGCVPDALAALAGAGIRVVALQHQIRNVDVQFIVETGQFDDAIRALHEALVTSRTDRTDHGPRNSGFQPVAAIA